MAVWARDVHPLLRCGLVDVGIQSTHVAADAYLPLFLGIVVLGRRQVNDEDNVSDHGINCAVA